MNQGSCDRLYPLPGSQAFIALIDTMGTEQDILASARVSTKPLEAPVPGGLCDRDKKLLRYLYKHEHWSPFEMLEAKFHIRAPIFVARQWMRHRTWSYNETSYRYAESDLGTYIPRLDEFCAQAPMNKQSSGAPLPQEISEECSVIMSTVHAVALSAYRELIDKGVARETARMVLPISSMTEFVAKADLRNILHFVKLRLDPGAQYQIRLFAEAIVTLLKPWVPNTLELFLEKDQKGIDGSVIMS